MKKCIIFLLLMLVMNSPVYADEAIDDCFDMAENFYVEGNFSQAKEYLKQVLILNPAHYGANCLLIKMTPPEGFLEETSLGSTIVVRPSKTITGIKQSDKFNTQGQEFYKKGDYEKAKEAFLSAIKCNSKNRYAYNNLGLTYIKLSNLSKAESAFKKSNRLCITFTAPLDNLAQMYIAHKDFVKARKYLNQAISKNRKDYCAYYLLGVTYKKEGKYSEAIRAFNTASQISPDFALTYVQLADAYNRTKDYMWSNSSIEKYLELSPNDDYAFYMMYRNYLGMQDYDIAKTYIMRAIMINNCIDYRVALATVENFLENPKGALDALKSIPNPSGEVLNEIGQCYLTLRDNDNALLAFQEASVKPYARPIYFYNIALVYKNIGDMDNYKKLLKALNSMQPMTVQDYIDLSGIYLDYAGKNKAIAVLDKGIKLSPKNKALYEAKLRIYNVTSDKEGICRTEKEMNKVFKRETKI